MFRGKTFYVDETARIELDTAFRNFQWNIRHDACNYIIRGIVRGKKHNHVESNKRCGRLLSPTIDRASVILQIRHIAIIIIITETTNIAKLPGVLG